MNKKTQTINTYNNSATALAEKFNSLGARISDIEAVFELVAKENPKVLEIGCGNRRDAEEIVKRTNDYLGIDISEKLIELAKQKVPHAQFEVADITTFEFPKNLDIVFAFASLIHITKEEFAHVIEKMLEALNSSGVVRISLKYSSTYQEVTEKSEFGIRTYYHYSQADIEELAADFTVLQNEVHSIRGAQWLEVVLRK
ncbi:MAG: class I SAM-dependent methyltransferase [Candidatus Zambryskibacteria bacterium]|nr:class I SAM-dependent methyltransferase [Candidatus Zambryskibacteria bacterium]